MTSRRNYRDQLEEACAKAFLDRMQATEQALTVAQQRLNDALRQIKEFENNDGRSQEQQ